VRAVKTTAKAQWAGSSPVEKAMTVGFPAASAGAALLGPEGNAPDSPGKGEKILRAAGSLGYMAPLPLGASMAFGTAAERVGGGVGKLIDRVRRPSPPPPPASTPGDAGQAAPVEHVYGSGVTGQIDGVAA
jgi:hypothetical protein